MHHCIHCSPFLFYSGECSSISKSIIWHNTWTRQTHYFPEALILIQCFSISDAMSANLGLFCFLKKSTNKNWYDIQETTNDEIFHNKNDEKFHKQLMMKFSTNNKWWNYLVTLLSVVKLFYREIKLNVIRNKRSDCTLLLLLTRLTDSWGRTR